ncbi:acyl-CoA dehydrogenase domain-containing protein [Reticulomyxa filosa]|uniref:Acyl-CoA dehydrogenase domain-containing protein n=1 Tax=Reticulomyxa filosa TaxID=46433 RepID=X6MPT0_RETFI|nr:acyl-CoA dehydrogenase domain-containing protein [Reticulomyxa filosa]|eukprot:ETO15412.1 acyl-CoA dehydrogenase domain-containing protein [Reticulomyxa filosa]
MLLSESEKEFKEGVRKFASEVVAPLAIKADQDNAFPNKLWPQFGSMGLLGVTAGEKWGGLDAGYFYHCLAMEEISRASGSIGLSYAAHSNLCVNQINLNGNDAQKEKYLKKLITGEYIGALAMSETGSGRWEVCFFFKLYIQTALFRIVRESEPQKMEDREKGEVERGGGGGRKFN